MDVGVGERLAVEAEGGVLWVGAADGDGAGDGAVGDGLAADVDAAFGGGVGCDCGGGCGGVRGGRCGGFFFGLVLRDCRGGSG